MKVLYYASVVGIALWCTLLLAPSDAHAAFPEVNVGQLVFSDDFSDGTLNKWEDIRLEPGGTWSIEDGRAQALVSRGSTLAELVPADEQWNESWHDLRFEFDYTPLEGVDRNISWKVLGPANWYEIHFGGGGWEAAHVLPSSVPWFVSGYWPMQNGPTYHVRIETVADHIRVSINDEIIMEERDERYVSSAGKIGLKAGAGSVAPTQVRFDNIQVWLLSPQPAPTPEPSPAPSPTPLPTPPPPAPPEPTATDPRIAPLKQTDQRWSSDLYDRATTWSGSQPPTIARWGCALASLTMIFHYHGLAQLPSGEPITPDTLNSWLINQKDGYVGEGMLNWAAAMRLTRLISEKYHTPKLEYAKSIAPPKAGLATQLTTARDQVSQRRPVILQIPGHFLVGDQLLTDDQQPIIDDIHIVDPYFAYTTFKQHAVPLVSTRTFTPSQTDLSYVVIVTDPDAQLSLISPDSSDITANHITEEYLQSPDSPQQTHHYQLLEVAKPVIGAYTLKVSAPALSTHGLQIFTYDQAGNVTDLSQEIVVGSQPTVFSIIIDADGHSTIQQNYSFQQLAFDLNTVALAQSSKRYAVRTLSRVAQAARNAPESLWPVYKKAISHYVEWYKPQLQPRFYDYLRQHVSLL